MWQITFEVKSDSGDRDIKLLPGSYSASVEVLSTDPVQYRVFNFSPHPDKRLREAEDQLLLLRLKREGSEIYEWQEAFNNTASDLAQVIGSKIEAQIAQAS